MSRSRTNPPSTDRAAGPQAAVEALLEGEAGDPIRRALWLDALDLQLRPCLPPVLAAHARLANIDGHRLVYLVDTPVWHARMRLAATELLDAARSLGLDVSDLTVKTSTLPLTTRATEVKSAVSSPPLSAAAREAIATALGTDDESPPKKDSS